MRHYAIRANGAKHKIAVTAALGVAAAAGLLGSRPAHAQITFTPPPDAPAGGVGYIGVKEVHYGAQGGGDGNPSIGNQDIARTNLVTPAANARISRYTAPTLNILDTGTDGLFNTGNIAFGVERAATEPRVGTTINVASGDINDIATLSRGVIRVTAATAGVYTFAVASDDGFTLAFPLIDGSARPFIDTNTPTGAAASLVTYNGTTNGAMNLQGGRGTAPSFARINLPAGDHPFVLTHHEDGGGASLEFYYHEGDKRQNLDGGWRLVGAPGARLTGRKYAGTVTSPGWNVIEMHSPGGIVEAGQNPAATPAQAPTSNLVNTIATYERLRRNINDRPPGYEGPAGPDKGTVYQYNTLDQLGTRVLNLGDFQPDSGIGEINPGVNRGDVYQLEQNRQVQGANNWFGIGARATINIDTASVYTFAVLTDDHFRFRVLNSAGQPVPILSAMGTNQPGGGNPIAVTLSDTAPDAGGTGDGQNDAFATTVPNPAGTSSCCRDGFGKYNLAPGNYTLEAIMFEATGGASMSVYGSIGDLNTFSSRFQLIGQNINDPNYVLEPLGLDLVTRPATWRGTTGAWNTATNWTYNEEAALDQDAILPNPVPSGGATLTLTAGRQVKSLTVNASYTLTGGTLDVGFRPPGVTTFDGGAVTVAASQTATFTNTTVTANSLQGPGRVSIGATGRINIRTKAIGGTDSTVGGLTIAGTRGAWTGKLDLNNNDITITGGAGTIADIADQVKSGYNNGAWDGNGITSTTLATAYAANNRTRGLGYGVQGANAAVKYTYTGDANIDEAVNGADFALLASNFGKTGQLWSGGDFNYDGSVNGADFALLAGNFGRQADPSLGLASSVTMSDWMALEAFGQSIGVAVPEPTAAGLVALGSLGLLARRRRRA